MRHSGTVSPTCGQDARTPRLRNMSKVIREDSIHIKQKGFIQYDSKRSASILCFHYIGKPSLFHYFVSASAKNLRRQ